MTETETERLRRELSNAERSLGHAKDRNGILSKALRSLKIQFSSLELENKRLRRLLARYEE